MAEPLKNSYGAEIPSAGTHRVDVILNGHARPLGRFEVAAAAAKPAGRAGRRARRH